MVDGAGSLMLNPGLTAGIERSRVGGEDNGVEIEFGLSK